MAKKRSANLEGIEGALGLDDEGKQAKPADDGTPTPPAEPATPGEPATPAESKEPAEPEPAPEPDDLTPPPDVMGEDEPPAEPATPAEPKEPDTPPAEPKPEKDVEALIRMRQENKQLKDQLKTADQKVGADQTEMVTKLRTDLKEARDVIARVSLENHPEFKAKYQAPMQAFLEQAQQVAKEADLDENIVAKAVDMTIKNRATFLSEKAPDVAPELRAILSQLDSLKAQRSGELKSRQADFEGFQKAQEEERKVRVQEVRDNAFTQTLAALQQEGHLAFTKSKTNEGWNEAVEALTNNAKAILVSDDHLAQTKSLMLGVAAPLYLKMYQNERTKRLELERQAQEREDVAPKVGSSTPAAPKGKDTDKNAPMSIEQLGDTMAKKSKAFVTA